MANPALQQLQEDLHISHSQIFSYLNCSLKYKFQYVEQRPAERLSSALPLGKMIHSVLETYYRGTKDHGQPPTLEKLLTLFEEGLTLQIENSTVPIIFKKEAPDLDSLIDMGQGLVRAFYENVDLDGMEIIDVELPLSAQLYNEHGESLDIKLIGFIDLLLKDSAGNLVVVDHKTSKNKKSQVDVDADLQQTAYSYLLAANGYTFPRAEIHCRFDVLRKLKKPTLEFYNTTRSAEDRKRFAKIASAVLAGIDNRIFIPCKSWLCTDCQFKDTCSRW